MKLNNIKVMALCLTMTLCATVYGQQFESEYDSGATDPHLNLIETGGYDWTRIVFQNSADAANRWTLSGLPANGHNSGTQLSPFALSYTGSEKFSVDKNGKVRINNAYTLPSSDGSNGQVLTTNGAGVLSWAAGGGGGSSPWTTSGANVYRPSGSVGIGTVPAAELHVKAASGNCDLRLESPSGGGYFRNYQGTTSLSYMGHNGNNLLIRNEKPNTDVYIQSEDDIQLWANGTTRLLIEDTGDVGIGILNPSTKLHLGVIGNDGLRIDGNDTGDARIQISNGGGSHFIFDDDSNNHALKIQSADDFAINVNGTTQKFRIDGATGDVNIYDQLEVSGKVFAGNDMRISGNDPALEFWNPQGGAHVGADIRFDYNNTGNTGTLDIRNFDTAGSIEFATSTAQGLANNTLLKMSPNLITSYKPLAPAAHKLYNLGENGKAWDNVYYDDLINQGAAAFLDRTVTEEIISFPPTEKKEGMFDYMTERGDIELDPNFLPPGLSEDNGILTDEMVTYNYKANYEQQQQINILKAENAQLKAQIEEILKSINK